MSPDPRKIGLFLVGARGAIATTVIHGLEGLRTGMPSLGMLTERPELAHLPWVDLPSLRVNGWDIAGDSHRSAEDLARVGVIPRDLVDLCADLRDRLELSMSPGYADPEDLDLLKGGARQRVGMTPHEAFQALRQDLRDWMKDEGYRRGVVVYLATAERQRSVPESWQDPEADPLALLESAPHELPRSIVYACAALAEGMPFINFTPAVGAALPATTHWARRQGIPLLGSDGKTGETLMKTVLAPMFRDRALKVLSWEGYNMLGNRDGAALEQPERAASKLQNKDQVLPGILGQQRMHTNVQIHFVPSLHDWKTAWDFIHFEGFLGTKMSLQFTWQGSDSALAAPLVLDLVRLAILAQDREQGGPLVAAAPFFKNPMGCDEHDFHRQMDRLRRWLSTGID